MRKLFLMFAALCLVAVAAVPAFAAHPMAGKTYRGSIPAAAYNGHQPPVTFNVGRTGRHINSFTWMGFGCFGAGGPGNPFIHNPYLEKKIGVITIQSNGKFSIKNAKWTAKSYGPNQPATTTWTTVNGRFVTPKKAVGTIVYHQSMVAGMPQSLHTCQSWNHGNPPMKFTATAK